MTEDTLGDWAPADVAKALYDALVAYEHAMTTTSVRNGAIRNAQALSSAALSLAADGGE